MTEVEILEKVQSIIAEKLSVEAADVMPEKSFTNDLGADSLDTVELIMEFENVFGVSIPLRVLGVEFVQPHIPLPELRPDGVARNLRFHSDEATA